MMLSSASRLSRAGCAARVAVSAPLCNGVTGTVRHMSNDIDPSRYEFLPPQLTKRKGVAIVHDPWTNKGTGFPLAERDRLRLRGLVPPRCLPLEEQAAKICAAVRERLGTAGQTGPLGGVGVAVGGHGGAPTAKAATTAPTTTTGGDRMSAAMYLSDLMDRNETLFFRVLIDNLSEFAPLVYTPTVGEVCQRFGSYFRRARGMYFSSQDRGLMSTMVYNWPQDDVEVVVVTDGSRILGLGDLGANGMGIPIGKLALYVAAGGVDPKKVLPCMIDAGTDNMTLRNDPWYLGMPHARLKGHEYFSLVHEFIKAVHHRWPNAVIQFEDFSSDKAMDLLEAYRYDHLSFNDDIQGTGAVSLASILAAVRTQGPGARLRDQRIVVCGAGSAGMGVAQSLYDAMLEEGAEPDEARNRFWILDKDGLLGPERRRDTLSPAQSFFAREHAGGMVSTGQDAIAPHIRTFRAPAPGNGLRDMANLHDVVKSVKPTILLGLTGVGGTFTEPIVREMGRHAARPIIFPLSNPTSHAECTAEQAYTWTEGRAVVASGSPFEPVVINGRKITPSQTNNMYIFPGAGLASTVVRPKRITDRMFYAAARALADMVTSEQLDSGMVLPPISDIRKVSARVAAAIAASGIADGIVQRMPPSGDLVRFMAKQMYDPRYYPIVNDVY